MPYVQRDAAGKIIALFREPLDSGQEQLPADHLDVLTFLSDGDSAPFSPFSDLQMIRVIEDVIDVLIRKQVILLTELPPAVQNKLLQQRSRRDQLFGSVSVLGEADNGIL